MITNETGILNPVPTPEEEVYKHFQALNDAFIRSERSSGIPNKELRRSLIAKAALTDERPPQFDAYATWVPMLAHWAEDEGTSRKRAAKVYDLQTTLNRYAGQTVLWFRRGNYPDLELPSTLPAPVVAIDIFRLDVEPVVDHKILKVRPEDKPKGFEDTDFMTYASYIPVQPRFQRIARSRTGEVKVTEPKIGLPIIATHIGRTSLHPSIDFYWDTVEESEEILLFGDDESQKALGLVIGATITGHLFDSRRAMRDLRFLPRLQKNQGQKTNDDLLARIDELLSAPTE